MSPPEAFNTPQLSSWSNREGAQGGWGYGGAKAGGGEQSGGGGGGGGGGVGGEALL